MAEDLERSEELMAEVTRSEVTGSVKSINARNCSFPGIVLSPELFFARNRFSLYGS